MQRPNKYHQSETKQRSAAGGPPEAASRSRGRRRGRRSNNGNGNGNGAQSNGGAPQQQQQQQQQQGGSRGGGGGGRRGGRRRRGRRSKNGNNGQQNGQQNGGNAGRAAAAAASYATPSSTPSPSPSPAADYQAPLVPGFKTDVTFESMGVSGASLRALTEVFGYRTATKVQVASMPPCLEGKDVLAKAKTGTGKTLGFLIPTVALLMRTRGGGGKAGAAAAAAGGNKFGAVVLSPTRELAQQIESESRKLCTYQPLNVVCVVGGNNIKGDRRRLAHKVDILVATPGRLQDHLDNTPGFKERCSALEVVILDECDRLLDMGFRPAITRILSYLPRKRQTLLFSATVPDALLDVANLALDPNHVFVNTVGEDDDQTNAQVDQESLVVDESQVVNAAYNLVRAATQEPNHKVIVFLPTARQAGYFAELFRRAGLRGTLEIHSRKSQSNRQKTSAKFRTGSNLVLVSSDVSARGVDYPNVSFILQIGLTTREQYIHRLGRTARAGKAGRGLLLLAHAESRKLLQSLNDLPINKASPDLVQTALQPPDNFLQNAFAQVESDKQFNKIAQMCYQAWLGFYNSNLRRCGFSQRELVQAANRWSAYIGLSEPPALLKRTVGKMGLKGVPGLKTVARF